MNGSSEHPISVKSYGAVADGVLTASLASGTDNTAAVQAAIDAAPDGATIVFPEGTYYLEPTSLLGSTYVLNETGTTLDTPDYVHVKIKGRRRLTIKGYGAEIIFNTGFPFFCIFNDHLSFEGIKFSMPSDVYTGPYSFGGTSQPSPVVIAYSVHSSIRDCTVLGAHRGLWLLRTSVCSIERNVVYGARYLGIASYGSFYVPPGMTIDGSPFNLATYFEHPHFTTSPGVHILDNYVQHYGYVGIYSDGRANIAHNRLEEFMPVSISGATIINGITQRAGDAGSTIIANRIKNDATNPWLLGTSGETVSYDGIMVAVEDVADGTSFNNTVIGNVIEGCCAGISIFETRSLLVQDNIVDKYSICAISMSGHEGVSSVLNVSIQGNLIGRVASGTKRSAVTGRNRGGITTYISGDGVLDNIYILDNVFRQGISDIADPTIRSVFEQNGIWLQGKDSSYFVIDRNKFNDDSGGIKSYNNIAGYQDRKVQGLPVVYSATATLPTGWANDVWVQWTGSSAGTLTLPEKMFLGQRIHLLNTAQSVLTVNVYGAGYTLCGVTSAMTLDNTAHAKARSSVTLVCISGSNSSNAYTLQMVGTGVLNGGAVALS